MSALQSIDPLPRTRRGWILLAIFAVFLGIAFALVVRFYSIEGGSRVEGGVGPSTMGGLLVTVAPNSLDATRELARVNMNFEMSGPKYVDVSGRLTDPVRVTVESANGNWEFRYAAGTLIGQEEIEIGLEGEVALYPFDQHSGALMVVADTYQQNGDGSVVSKGPLLVGLQPPAAQNEEGQVAVGINGWDTTMKLTRGMEESGSVELTFNRAFSTQIFALLILTIAGMLALLALAAGVLVYTGRRPAEGTLLGWTAALLFALPALRNYLPNSPPLGASIDMYAYLWFMVAAGMAQVLMILGWSMQRAAERRRQHELDRDRLERGANAA